MDVVNTANIPLYNVPDTKAFVDDLYPIVRNYPFPKMHIFTMDSLVFPRSLLCSQRRPVILRGIPIGPCAELWTSDHLQKYGGSQDVKVHVTTNRNMDFINKNFLYRTLQFNELVKRASREVQDEFFINEKEMYYLRSLGTDHRKEPADIRLQFPELSKEITIPTVYAEEAFFSSVLRVASPQLCLWTHYDVMDNMLIQVTGRKKAVLFHPNDSEYLYLKGDKSQVLDVDNPDLDRYPDFIKAKPYRGILEPGDILFIPALWFHNMTALDFGVAVNVFWRHLGAAQYDQNDMYGNKDPIPAAKAFTHLRKAIRELQQLPTEYQEFYGRQMIMYIKSVLP